jgi:hypothetical protein
VALALPRQLAVKATAVTVRKMFAGFPFREAISCNVCLCNPFWVKVAFSEPG